MLEIYTSGKLDFENLLALLRLLKSLFSASSVRYYIQTREPAFFRHTTLSFDYNGCTALLKDIEGLEQDLS